MKSGLARHGRAIASVLLVQSLLIVWLSSWAIGDYSNNQYVKAYVDLTVQSLMWVFGAVVILGLLASVLGLVVRRRRASTLELVGVGPKVPISRPVAKTMTSVTRSSGSVSRPSPALMPSVTSVSATGVEVSAPKAAVELHPAVAALKAELSEARMSLGLASVTTGSQMPMSPAQRFEDQRAPQSTQIPSHVAYSPSVPSRPEGATMGQIPPPTVIRPMAPQAPSQNVTPTLGVRSSPPPTVIRPMMPPSGPNDQQMISPMSRPPGSSPPPSPHPVGVPARPDAGPSAPKDVSTVITGIMPVLKKKDESASSSDQNGQQK